MYRIAALLLTACETALVRREDYVAEDPEWGAKMVNAGMVVKGMTKEQVRATWGRHCFTCQGTTSGTWGESWEYITQVVFLIQKAKWYNMNLKECQ